MSSMMLCCFVFFVVLDVALSCDPGTTTCPGKIFAVKDQDLICCNCTADGIPTDNCLYCETTKYSCENGLLKQLLSQPDLGSIICNALKLVGCILPLNLDAILGCAVDNPVVCTAPTDTTPPSCCPPGQCCTAPEN